MLFDIQIFDWTSICNQVRNRDDDQWRRDKLSASALKLNVRCIMCGAGLCECPSMDTDPVGIFFRVFTTVDRKDNFKFDYLAYD